MGRYAPPHPRARWPLCANILDPVRAAVVCQDTADLLEYVPYIFQYLVDPICHPDYMATGVSHGSTKQAAVAKLEADAESGARAGAGCGYAGSRTNLLQMLAM